MFIVGFIDQSFYWVFCDLSFLSGLFFLDSFLGHFAKNVYKKKDIHICIQAMTNLRTWQEEKH